jgi:serine protease Do/serine protease DegQ
MPTRLIRYIRFFCLTLAMLMPAVARAALPLEAGDQKLPSLAPMLGDVTPAVVNIATEGKVKLQQSPLFADPFFRRFFNIPNMPTERKTQSLGSGVIVDAERGLVLTNNHVIANAVQITVTLRDGRQLDAELVGTDPETDVAVIRVPAENLTAIKPTNSDDLRVGDFVVAIGNPFGLGQTVTSGIISALSRSGLGIEGYEDFIQTDASINPGNSGGALVNLKGELVGINTAIFSQSGGNIGIGFAIPANLALNIMEQLVETGGVERGFLGVHAQDLSPELAEAFGLDNRRGAVINRIMENSPAAEAGFEPGDVVVKMNGHKIRNAGDLRNRIGLLSVNEEAVFEILRNGETRTIKARIKAQETTAASGQYKNERLSGLSVAELDESHPLYGQLEGVIIADVERGSPAWQAGLRTGDIITSINRQNVTDLQSFLTLVDQVPGSLLLRVVRGNTAAFLVIK